MNYLFPASIMANNFAMTAIMIVSSFAGKSDVAADIGIVHGVTVALFYALSANARSMILNPSSGVSSQAILGRRLLLLLPVGAISCLLSTQVAGVEPVFAFLLVLRRCAEWIAEVYVSDMELRNQGKSAARFLALQTVLTWTVIGWLMADLPALPLVILVWGASPLWFSSAHLFESVHIGSIAVRTWVKQLPHFGSTAVIGVSVYVFRLLLLLLVGKTIAGDLYAVFAIGGFLGTVFAQAIGPTLVLQEVRGSARQFPAWLTAAIALSLLSGAALFALASVRPDQLLWTGKSGFFWMGLGLSLIGGVFMVAAQWVRLGLVQVHAGKDVFGPDVVANILIVASVPFSYHLFGMNALVSLYLISSLLSLICYSSAARSADLWTSRFQSWAHPVKAMIVVLLFVPIFFQLSGEVFSDTEYQFDTGGSLTRLPIPVSVLACYGGIVLLGRFERAHMTLTVVFFTFTLMLGSSVLLTYGHTGQEKAKLILLIQFVLPMFALVLGQMFDVEDRTISVVARAFLVTLAAIVPAQLVASWLRGHVVLSPYMYLFSVYQHFQYVPVMFAAAYLIALFSLWDVRRYRLVLLTMSIPIGIFMAAAMSTLACIALIVGVVGFAAYRRLYGWSTRQVLILCFGVVISVLGYFWIVANTSSFTKYRMVSIEGEGVDSPKNVAQRIGYWKFYGKEVFSDLKSAVLGHMSPPDRAQYPSAHNYYLDFAYNYGLIALLPLLGLIAGTLVMVSRNWGAIAASLPLLGLVSVVLFLVLVENSFKVGMRQPYPGILTFFLWGVLLAQLSRGTLNTGSPSLR
jgi:hypothetical protein